MRRFFLLIVCAAGGPVLAQEAPVAVTWSAEPVWVGGYFDAPEGSDWGAGYPRLTTASCRSSVEAGMEPPVVVRLDSTQTTLVGRGAPTVDAVAPFPGSAWDVSDPAAPRRLNVLLRERAAAADGQWTPGAWEEYLLVMTSSYDGTGTAYAGRNLSLQESDCAWAVRLYNYGDGVATVEATIRRALVSPVTVRRSDAPDAPSATTLEWETAADGAAVRVRRIPNLKQTGPVVATLPPTARTFTDAGYPADSAFRYRVEVVDDAGEMVASSPLSIVPIPRGQSRMTVRGSLELPRNPTEVWGHVGADGREYALLNADGLTVIDVTDPQPVAVAHVPGGTSDIEAAGRYVYVTGDSDRVQVIDLADPAHPLLVRQFWGHPASPNVGVHTLSIEGERLFLTGNASGVSIWSLADPAQPTFLSTYLTDSVHDVLVRGDTMFVAMISGHGVDVVDLSDPTAPARLTTFNYPNSGAHNLCASPDGRYLFVGDEVGLGPWTRVFDIADLDNVELVAEIVVNRGATVHNCHVRGDLLFLGHYTMGVRVWNIADPTQPVEVAYDNGFVPEGDMFGFSGAWSAYPHLPSGRILVSNYGALYGPEPAPALAVLELDAGVIAEAPAPATGAFALALAPNPTAGVADALVTLGAPATVTADVLDALGRRVARVEAGRLLPGSHRVALPVAGLPTGVYVVRVVAGDMATAQRLTVVR